jgi:hypothetical protein
MENAHLRLGLLEYVRFTEKASTRIRLRVDRYIGEDRQAHLLSVFGNDSDTLHQRCPLGPVHTPWVVATGTSFSQFKE